MDISGKTVVITGASRGIGEAAARIFAENGANVALLARSGTQINAIASEIGSAALAVQCDVSDLRDVEAAVAKTVQAFGSVDVLINNAGMIDPIGALGDVDPDAWSKLIDVNVKGVHYGNRTVLPLMQKAGGGSILTISSGAAHNAIEGWSAYCASKAAVNMMNRSLHLEYASAGIRAIGLSPGTVATEMQREIKASGINAVSKLEWSDHVPPEWPAKCLLWMCSAEADAYLGDEISLRDESVRKKVGLV